MIKWLLNYFDFRTKDSKLGFETKDEKHMFNVDNFNKWFCHKDNGAVYAHEGIFLRLDKLSMNHIDDYFLKSFNIRGGFFKESTLQDFYEEIKKDWKEKIFLKNK